MPITISGSIFNFTESGYAPPTWSGADTYSFGSFTHSVRQIYTDNYTTYAATGEGLSIFDLATGNFYAQIIFAGGFNTVTGNDSTVYVGTTNSGIHYVDKTCISGSLDTVSDVTSCLTELSTPNITSNSIKYLDVRDNQLLVCTLAGVDYYRYNTNPFIHSKTSVAGAQKCFATENSMYYTVSGTNSEYYLNRLDACLTDWVDPTVSYTTGSGIFSAGLKLTDMYITEGTAEYGGNTIFCTTTSGIYVIDEDLQHFAIYYTR